jgi:DNA transformation protein
VAVSDGSKAFVAELFAGLGLVQIKRMFGGAGVYADGVMFALVSDDIIYLKADDALKAELATAPFSFGREGEQVDTSYWRLPDDALDDPDIAAGWGRKALRVAQAKALNKKPKKRATKKA